MCVCTHPTTESVAKIPVPVLLQAKERTQCDWSDDGGKDILLLSSGNPVICDLSNSLLRPSSQRRSRSPKG